MGSLSRIFNSFQTNKSLVKQMLTKYSNAMTEGVLNPTGARVFGHFFSKNSLLFYQNVKKSDHVYASTMVQV